jgi:hypothetical protein
MRLYESLTRGFSHPRASVVVFKRLTPVIDRAVGKLSRAATFGDTFLPVGLVSTRFRLCQHADRLSDTVTLTRRPMSGIPEPLDSGQNPCRSRGIIFEEHR